MLLLAGIDRLDKELTVGQMQGLFRILTVGRVLKYGGAGKFQMQVLSHCGHTVHEDTPDKVAEIIATFLVRHKLAEPSNCFERFVDDCGDVVMDQ
jgi:protein phosphatase methylesterase 1